MRGPLAGAGPVSASHGRLIFYLYCWLYALCISSPVVVSTRDLREALKAAILWSLPLRGRVVEVASKLLSLGFHTGDPITNQRHHSFCIMD